MGTLYILRHLIWTGDAPTYARIHQQFALRRNPGTHSAPSSSLGCGVFALMFILFLMLCSAGSGFRTMRAAFLPAWLWRWLIEDTGALTGIIVIAGGLILVAGSVGQVITTERQSQRWHDLLLLPVDRSRVILSMVASVYAPLFSLLGLLIVLFSSQQISGLTLNHELLLYIPLLIEWLQLQALGVSIGITGAIADRRRVSMLILIATLITLRGVVGWMLAALGEASLSTRGVAPLIGPLVGVPVFYQGAGLLIGVGYLWGLELIIRGIFRWGVEHAGDEGGF
jgi:hypothetical protein